MIEQIIIVITLILLCGMFDRLRGDKYNLGTTFIEKVMYGIFVGVLCLDLTLHWILVPFALLFALGSSPGWGDPLGAYLGKRRLCGGTEFWQIGFWEHHTVKSLWVRGFIWGAPLLSLLPWINTLPAFIACWVSFPLALKLARDWSVSIKITDKFNLAKGRWDLGEIYRGLLIGSITWGLSYVV